MKKIFAALSLVILVISCKKEDLQPVYAELEGEWEFVQYSGFGIPHTPGTGKIIAFENDGGFERRTHDTVLFRGSYTVEKKRDCDGSGKYLFLKTTDDLFTNNFRFIIHNDSMIISSPSCYSDGDLSIYRKL